MHKDILRSFENIQKKSFVSQVWRGGAAPPSLKSDDT